MNVFNDEKANSHGHHKSNRISSAYLVMAGVLLLWQNRMRTLREVTMQPHPGKAIEVFLLFHWIGFLRLSSNGLMVVFCGIYVLEGGSIRRVGFGQCIRSGTRLSKELNSSVDFESES